MKNANVKRNTKNLDFLILGYAGLFANLILTFSTLWFSYLSLFDFYIEIAIVNVILIFGLIFKRIFLKFSLLFALLFYALFLFFNFNYFFVFGLSLILGLMIINFLKPEVNVPFFIYSLIPLFILGHILWFNLLPLGFDDEFRVDVGTDNDISTNADIYLIDSNRVLSPTQSYGNQRWRAFEKDGTFFLGFNTPVNLENKTVEVSMRYQATGPIYINDELFYDPLWGTAVNFASFKEEYIYGSEKFNLSIQYEKVPLNKFLSLTGAKSVEDYILDKYDENVTLNNESSVEIVELLEKQENFNENDSLNLLKKSKTPIEIFLYKRNMSLQEFIDSELNNGPYPKNRSLNYSEFESVEEYVRENFPQGILIKDFTGNYYELEKEMISKYNEKINSVEHYEGWSGDDYTADVDFRGNVKFYGVFDESIKFSVLKKDMNLYNGSDSVIVFVKDLDDNIIANFTIPDNDGVVVRTTDESDFKKYEFEVPLDNSGLYKLEFKHEFSNEDPDFIISNLTTNSNKVMVDGSFMLWSDGGLYSNYEFNTISVRYWWSGYAQSIFYGNGTVFELSEDYRGSWVDLNLSNEIFIEFEKGILIVNPEYDLALTPNTKISTDFVETVQITKSMDLKNENIKFVNINGLNITSTEGTKISQIKIKIN